MDRSVTMASTTMFDIDTGCPTSLPVATSMTEKCVSRVGVRPATNAVPAAMGPVVSVPGRIRAATASIKVGS